MIIIISAVTVLGVLIVNICSLFYKNSRLEDLKSVGNFFINCISDEYKSDKNRYIKYSDSLRQKLMDNHNVKIFLYDNNEKCLIPDSLMKVFGFVLLLIMKSLNFLLLHFQIMNLIFFSEKNSILTLMKKIQLHTCLYTVGQTISTNSR